MGGEVWVFMCILWFLVLGIFCFLVCKANLPAQHYIHRRKLYILCNWSFKPLTPLHKSLCNTPGHYKNRDRLLSNKMTPLLEFPISFFVKFFTYRVWLSFKYQYENIRETLQLHKERSTLHWVDKRFAAEIVRRLTIVSL